MEIPMKSSDNVIRVLALTAFAVIATLGAPSAQAQWKVYDKDANDVLGKQKGGTTINSNLYDIKTKMDIGAASSAENWPGKRVDNPDSTFPKSTDATAIKLNDGTACKSVAESQQDTCNKIVEIENAQYKFMVTMYETSQTRDDTLREILKERTNLKSDDFGKLEDNTNKLNALNALIQLDRQQMVSVNYAYEANLRFLRAKQATLAGSAQKGGNKGDWGNITIPGVGDVDAGNLVNDVIGGAVLKATLDGLQTTKPGGMQTLKVTEGF
jgi:hypothetical protein